MDFRKPLMITMVLVLVIGCYIGHEFIGTFQMSQGTCHILQFGFIILNIAAIVKIVDWRP